MKHYLPPWKRGDPRRVRIEVTDDEANPVDLSGQTWTAQLRRRAGAPLAGTFAIDTSDVATGVLVLSVDGDATRALPTAWVSDVEGSESGTLLTLAGRVSDDVTIGADPPEGGHSDALALLLTSTTVQVTQSGIVGPPGGSGGGSGTSDHRELTHRDAADAHPMEAITGLDEALSNIELEPGPKGDKGDKGDDGDDGESAYELAVADGYEGTLEEWLESLVGPAGEKGDDGDSHVPTPVGQPDGKMLATASDALVYVDAAFATVDAGDDLTTARPDAGVVYWQFEDGTDVGDAGENIVNAVDGDLWVVFDA